MSEAQINGPVVENSSLSWLLFTLKSLFLVPEARLKQDTIGTKGLKITFRELFEITIQQ